MGSVVAAMSPRSLAVLSMHTSPLAQPGTGDGGGMNVYVRELCSALARSGTQCDVFVRSWSPELPRVVPVEPGLRVHHVVAGPEATLPKSALGGLVEDFADAVAERIEGGPWGPDLTGVDAIHANYWLSAAAGHLLKHRLGLPLVCTFHTLSKVKAEAGLSGEDDDPGREDAEYRAIGCSDAVLASNAMEAAQLQLLYQASEDRIELVPLGVDHAFFSPGQRTQARRAVGLPVEGKMLLFLGRIQPLKGADLAVAALAELRRSDAFLAVVGGPSGGGGAQEMDRLRKLAAELGVIDRVFFVPPQPHELVSSYYRAADVCVVPSRSESFGLVALEAAACGTPVVASAVGGLRQLVRDGVTGHLIEERSPASFAAALSSILDRDDRAAAMSQAAAGAARSYSWGVAAERLRRLIDRLAAGQLVECR
jgi:D-inositol-3-phosphate glycosyltransferase